mmetsp:Transcript_41775/g.100619  ORF Transcript_41775/g.100619 Transcript_41775/m.100619 type:complete len:106 (+) Transcript_41775:308-625(+)
MFLIDDPNQILLLTTPTATTTLTWILSNLCSTVRAIVIQLFAAWTEQWKPKQRPKENENSNHGTYGSATNHILHSRKPLTMAAGAGDLCWGPDDSQCNGWGIYFL